MRTTSPEGAAEPPRRVLLIDDLRSFRDDRPHVVARTAAAGIEALRAAHEAGRGWAQVWLDHDLGGSDLAPESITPVIDWLCQHALDDDPVDVDEFVVHTSNGPGGAGIIRALEKVGYRTRRVPAQPFLRS